MVVRAGEPDRIVETFFEAEYDAEPCPALTADHAVLLS
jgi:hypothetical protein